MKIGGLQKLTLIDYPGKLACTLFLYGCNFKCGFCHNPELVLPGSEIENSFSEESVLEFLEERKKYLDGICITGGEPLLNEDIEDFLRKAKNLGYDIKIDTNGTNPELLRQLIKEKLVDYVAMDVKTDKENYDLLSGVVAELDLIGESIKILIKSGIDYEFRTTVIPGEHDKMIIENIGRWLNEFGKPKKYFLQNFVPRENKLIDEKFEKKKSFSNEGLEILKKSAESYFEEVGVRG